MGYINKYNNSCLIKIIKNKFKQIDNKCQWYHRK